MSRSLRHPLVLMLTAAAALVVPAPATAAAPTCFGVEATIVAAPDSTYQVEGTAGDDTVWLDGRHTYSDPGGKDRVCGASGYDSIDTGAGIDRIRVGRDGGLAQGGAGADLVVASDVVRPSGGHKLELQGGSGDDRIVGSALKKSGSGEDEETNLLYADRIDAGSGDDLVLAGPGRDEVVGGPGNDRLLGQAGDDLLDPSAGDDLVIGGQGTDRLSYNRDHDREHGVRIDLRAGRATGLGTDRWRDVEQFEGGWGSDALLGTSGRDWLSGDLWTEKSDRVVGRGGADTLFVARGSVSGGAGDDRVTPGRFGARVRAEGGPGDDTFEVEYMTGALAGGPGADRFVDASPDASDLDIDGGSGPDTLDWYKPLLLDTAAGTARELGVPAGRGTDWRIRGLERFLGSTYADEMHGSARAEAMFGRGGDDYLSGHGGNDHLDGGPGADTVKGGKGRDTCAGETVTTCEAGA